MSRRLLDLRGLFLIAGFCGPMASPGEAQDLLAPATPEPLIQRWAERVPEPLWRIPIGQRYVDGMDRVDADHLFVGLRSIGQQVFNEAGLLVDIRSGRVVWRSQREKDGVYAYLFSDAEFIFEQYDDAPEHRFTALDKATGAVRWQIRRNGDAVRFVLAPGHGLVLAETQNKKKIEVEAFHLSNGARAWSREHRLPNDAAAPASAAVLGDTICVFYRGLETLRSRDGTSLWRRADIVVLKDDPPPRQAPGALIIVHGARLEALKPQTGETVWSAALSMRASSISPISDRVYLRGVLPYRDAQKRFALQVPTGWPLNWQKDDVAYRFEDMAGGAFLLVTWLRPEPGSRLDLSAIYQVMQDTLEHISDGRLTQLDKQDLSIAGMPARWARFQHAAKAAEGVQLAAVTEVVAVYNEELQAGCGLLGFSPISHYDTVKEDLGRAFRSLRFTRTQPDEEPISTVDRWRQRSASAVDGTTSVASHGQGRSADPAGDQRYRIAAFRSVDGHQLWHHDTAEPTVSNLVAQRGRIYLATSQDVLALNAASGNRVFAVTATDVGKAFPVRLRAYEDRVVYIGELVVAAYDPTNGAKIYRHGITPLSQETTLDGLDNSIPVFEEIARAVGGIQPQGNVAGLIAGIKANESVRYQQLADRYDARARTLKGLGADNSLELQQRDMANTIADIEATGALAQSLVSVGGTLWEMFRIRGWVRYYRNFLTHQQLFRRSIISAYTSGETWDFVHRPHRRLDLSGDGDFATVTVIHLPTGIRRTTTLSPNYLNYGLWNYVDYERGLAVHHGLGLDTTFFEYGPKERVGAFGDVRTVGSFLLAVPVEIPESNRCRIGAGSAVP